MHIPEWNASVGISMTSTTWVPLHYMNFLHVYTGMKRLWWSKASAGWSIACTTWVSFTLHGFFECIYRNQTTSWPISDLHYMRSITLHELFARVYWNETPLMVCWMVFSLHYMSFFTLHGFFECIYRNETPLLAYLWLPLHEFLYTTWSSLHVYTGMKRLWWLVFSLHYMRSITLHDFLKHMLAKASVGWSIA